MALPANRQEWARIGAWLWGFALLIACLVPSNEIPEVDVPLADKWVHFVLFGVQTLLMLLGLHHPRRASVIRVVIFCVLFGLVVEILQYLTYPWLHRAFDLMDMGANTIGVFMGVLLFGLWQRTRTRQPSVKKPF
jgi:VanZ family protein